MNVIGRSISKNALVLGAFAIVTAGLLAYIAQDTAPRIAANKRAVLELALSEVFPASAHDNNLLDDTESLLDPALLGYRKPMDAYIAMQAGQVTGVVMQVSATEGYNGSLDLLVGVNNQGVITGVRVISHKETPGLGDKVDLKKSPWILEFDGRSLTNPDKNGWAVKKVGGAFDSFTGATITPRAVIKGVHQSLEYFQQNSQQLLSAGTDVSQNLSGQNQNLLVTGE